MKHKNDPQSTSKLRVFRACEDNANEIFESNESPRLGERSAVRLSLADIAPLLVDASKANRAWLHDFSDETIQVSSDLYEVLIAYKRIIDESNQAHRKAA